ncbi:MAG: TIGR02147 family protein [Fibrobacteres bacterium]|nr:TIGR02147 family protein [Fibrobacterota bacterium]
MLQNASRPGSPPPPVVFSFLDHREFLRRWYEWKKLSSRGFSYRSFAKKAGFSSMSFLRDVIEGRRNISEDSVEKFLGAIGLVEDAAVYFRELVKYNRETDDTKKAQSFRKLLLLQARREFSSVKLAQSRYYSDWIHVVLREVAPLERFEGNAKRMGESIRPALPTAQVQESLELLLELGMLEKAKDGSYRQTNARLIPGDQDAAIIRNAKRQMLLHALDRLDQGPPPDTLISSTTLAVSRHRAKKIAEQLRQFGLDLLADTVTDDGPVDQVVQINFQLIPFLCAPPDD